MARGSSLVRRAWLPAAILAAAALGLRYSDAGLAVSRSAAVDLLIPLVMFLVSLRVRAERIVGALRRPWPILASLALVYGVFPPLAWGVQSLVGPAGADGYAAMMILAAQPSTLATASVLAGAAGGDAATAMVCTLSSQVVSVAATPWLLALWVGSSVPVDVGGLMGTLLLSVLLPVAVGQAARWPWRSRLDAWSGGLGVAAEAVVVGFVFVGFATARPILWEHPGMVGGALAAVTIVHLAMLGLSGLASRGLGLDGPGRIGFTLASAQKTLAAGILVWRAGFLDNRSGPILVVLHHVVQLLVDSLLAPVLHRLAVPGRRPFPLT
jgi:predicted Na+-dependent transporter